MKFALCLMTALLFVLYPDARRAWPHTSAKLRTSGLHVMSYNIKGLPSLLTGGDYKNARYELIGKLLAERALKDEAPAIVLLQEAFSENVRPLFEAAAYPHMAQGPDSRSWVGLDSGLYILSRFPILERAHREFGPYPNCNGWDCFAPKGVQFVRIAVEGLSRPLEVFNTHLQAGRDSPPARARQVEILIEFFKKHHTPGNPVLFGGDFNLRPERDRALYDQFVRATGLNNSGEFCLERGCSRSPDTGWQGIWKNAVDHQFYSTWGQVVLLPISVERSYRESVRGLKLSDHAAHEVRFEFKTQIEKSYNTPL